MEAPAQPIDGLDGTSTGKFNHAPGINTYSSWPITPTLNGLHTTGRAQTVTLLELLRHICMNAGPWLLTTKSQKARQYLTTAMHATTREVLRAKHDHGATTVCKGTARAFPDRVRFVKPAIRLDECRLAGMMAEGMDFC